MSLQIFGEDGIGDRPANDREILGPVSGRHGSLKIFVKPKECIANEIAIFVSGPTRKLLSKCLPVFVSAKPIPDLSCVDAPDGPVSLGRPGRGGVDLEFPNNLGKLQRIEVVLQGK